MLSTWTPQTSLAASVSNLVGLENGAWSKAATTIVNDAIIINGVPADKMEETAVSSTHVAQQFLSFTSGRTYTFSAVLKAAERGWAWLYFPGAAFGVTSFAYYNLSTGAIGTMSAGVSATTRRLGDGAFFCTLRKTATATASGNMGVGTATADATNSYLGVLTNGIYVGPTGLI